MGGVPVATREIANAFGKFFSTKVNTLLANSKIEPGVYNGKNKLIVQNRNFMTKTDIRECIYSIKSKRCEGYDRIPVTAICDARDVLLEPHSVLFDKIYYSGKLHGTMEDFQNHKCTLNTDLVTLLHDLQILAKGPEPGLYEAPEFCWSFIQFYDVNLKDHNKFIQFNSIQYRL